MSKNIFITCALLAFAFSYQPIAKAQAQGPIVVELFTSQGCSSCPPADQVLNQLADNPDFIALSYHVTYWDYIGWKDSLGRVFADKRQRSYSNYKRSSRVYTPQMIINGGKEFVGSRKHEANRNLSNAQAVKPITMAGLTPDGTMIALPKIKQGSYTLWIAGVKKQHEQSIKRGENRGKMITYKNTVLSLEQSKQKWNGNAQTLTMPLAKKPDIDYYVIFAQTNGYGPIQAAGKIGI